MFIARSLMFYPDYIEDNYTGLSDEIILPSYHLNTIMDRFDDNEMLYVNIINIETNQSYLVTIGSAHSYDKNTIFAPQWILELIGCTGACDSVIMVEKANVSHIPTITQITIKPLDPVAFDINTQECFEKAFMNLHSIKEGITIPIPVPELGENYQMFTHIEKVEPATVSRIIHGEVDVVFINEFKHAPSSSPVLGSMIPQNDIVTPLVDPSTDVVDPSTDVVEEISAEERRNKVREAWLKRFQNNAK